jgi:hypothetical protein
MMEKYKPVPGGECQVRFSLPLPAVCDSTTTTVPEAAPFSPSSSATRFDDSVFSSLIISRRFSIPFHIA